MSSKITKGIAGAAVGMLAWTAPALAATSGTQTLTFVVREAPNTTSCLAIASGPISGVGTCVLDEQSEEVVTVHVALGNGSFDVVVSTVTEDSSFNSQACVFQFTDTDAFTITGGSGAFASASGS